MKKRYVACFVFTPDFNQVLLIHKNRPQFLKGSHNGIGGKFEEGESGEECSARELTEESSITIDPRDFVYVGTISGIGSDSVPWEVLFYGAVYSGDPRDACSCTDEEVGWYPRGDLPKTVWNNVPWLVALTYDKLTKDMFKEFMVTYKDGAQ